MVDFTERLSITCVSIIPITAISLRNHPEVQMQEIVIERNIQGINILLIILFLVLASSDPSVFPSIWDSLFKQRSLNTSNQSKKQQRESSQMRDLNSSDAVPSLFFKHQCQLICDLDSSLTSPLHEMWISEHHIHHSRRIKPFMLRILPIL